MMSFIRILYFIVHNHGGGGFKGGFYSFTWPFIFIYSLISTLTYLFIRLVKFRDLLFFYFFGQIISMFYSFTSDTHPPSPTPTIACVLQIKQLLEHIYVFCKSTGHDR